MRYFLDISYDGTGFCGWQMQPGEPSIQASLEAAICRITGIPTAVTGAGRTDAGVHARQMIAHFDSASTTLGNTFLKSLNAVLDPRISVNAIYPVSPEAHARFSAISRTYHYIISHRKDPFLEGKSYLYTGELDIPSMQECCLVLTKNTDFQCFSKVNTDVTSFNCHIFAAKWVETANAYTFIIQANRFLRNMVRAIVGTMMEVGRGKMDTHGFERVLLSKDRSKAGASVPAKGLYLWEIDYPSEIYL